MNTAMGFFGGTFDPPHRAHRQMASAFADELSLSEVLLIPAGDPYHKHPAVASGERRLAMCRFLSEYDPRLSVSDIDLVRPGATRTVDTLSVLRQSFPDKTLWWLLGSDSLRLIHRWHRFRDLFRLANFAVARRDGDDLADLPEPCAEILSAGLRRAGEDAPTGQIVILKAQPDALHSDDLRRALRAGQDPGTALDAEVYAYIRAHGLYQPG